MSSLKVSSHYLVYICDSLTLRVSKSYQGMLTWCTLFQKALLETSEGAAKLLDPLRAAKNCWWSVSQVWKEVMTAVSVWPLSLFSRSIKGVRASGCRRHLQVLDTAAVLLYGESTALVGSLGHSDVPPWFVGCENECILWAPTFSL